MKSSSSFRLLKDKNSLLITHTISSRRSSAYWKTFLRCSRRLIRKSEWKVEIGGRVSKSYTQIRNPPAGVSASKKLLSEWFYEEFKPEGGQNAVVVVRPTQVVLLVRDLKRLHVVVKGGEHRTSDPLSRLLRVRNGWDRLKQVERFLLQVSSWLGEKLE